MKTPLGDGGKPIEYGDPSYIYDGIYNPIVWVGKEPYRPRVETLVIRDRSKLFLRIYNKPKSGMWYTLPGGSIDADSTKAEQARNETNEEALIELKDLYYTGIQYYARYKPGFVRGGGNSPIEYVGTINDVFVAAYAGPFDKSKVEPKDLDPDIADNGKFYPIKDILPKLIPEHIRALHESPLVDLYIKKEIGIYIANNYSNAMESMNPDFPTVLPPGDFIYHGSKYKFDVFHPMSIDFGNAQQEPGWSTFAFAEPVLALRFGLMRTIQGVLSGNDDERCQWNFKLNKPYIPRYMYKDIRNKVLGLKFFVYHIRTEGLAIGVGNDVRFPEYTFREDNVRPYMVQSYTIDDVILRDHLEPMDLITMRYYEDEELPKFNYYKERHHAAFINHDYENDPKIQKLLQAVEEKRLQPGDDVKQFMIDNDLVPDDLDWKIPITEATQKKPLTQKLLLAYKKKYPHSMLRHARTPDDKNQGRILMDKSNLVGYVMVDTSRHMITALEAESAYRGKGVGKELLDIATKELGAKYLTVNKKNIPAIALYKKCGWKVYKETDTMFFMSAPEVTEITEGYTIQPSKLSTMVPVIESRLTAVGKRSDPVANMIDFIMDLRTTYNYGYPLPDGRILDRNRDRKVFIDHYRTMSLKDFEKYRCGICFEFAWYSYEKLTKGLNGHKYNAECYYIETDYPDGYRACHTFVIVEIRGLYYWADCTWSSSYTLIEFRDKKKLLDIILAGWNGAHAVKHCILKTYTPNKKLVGLTFYEFMNTVGGYIPDIEPIEESTYTEELYRLIPASGRKPTQSKLIPKVPNNFLTKGGYEEDKTPRVCFADSIDGCLRAYSQNIEGMEFIVVQPVGHYKVITPTITQVPDAKVTGEKWITTPVKYKIIGSIKVGKAKDKSYTYKYGDRVAELYDWDWQWESKQESFIDIDEIPLGYGEQSHGIPENKSIEGDFPEYKKYVVAAYKHEGEYLGLLDWEESIEEYIKKHEYGLGLYYVYGSNKGYPEYAGKIIVNADKSWYPHTDTKPESVTEGLLFKPPLLKLVYPYIKSDPERVLKEIVDELKTWEYGYVINPRSKLFVKGVVVTDVENDPYFVENYKTLSIAEFERYKCGTCFDYTNYIYYLIVDLFKIHDDYDITCYYIEGHHGNDYPCHAFPIVRLRNTGQYYYMETAWKSNAGLVVSDGRDEKKLLKSIISKWLKSNRLSEYSVLCEYVPGGHLVGVDCFTFMNTVNRNTNIKL